MLLEFEKKIIRNNIEVDKGWMYNTYTHELEPDLNDTDGQDFYYTLIHNGDICFLRTTIYKDGYFLDVYDTDIEDTGKYNLLDEALYFIKCVQKLRRKELKIKSNVIQVDFKKEA